MAENTTIIIKKNNKEKIWSHIRSKWLVEIPEVTLSVRALVKLMVNRGEIDPDELGLGETVFGVKCDNDSLVDISRRYSSPTTRMQRQECSGKRNRNP